MVICFYCTGTVDDKDFISVELYNHKFRVRKPFCNFMCLLFWLEKNKDTYDYDNKFLTFGDKEYVG